MKNLVFLFLFLLSLSGATVQAQERSMMLLARTGYTRFGLSDPRRLIEEGISFYRGRGIPLELQTAYPPNALVGAELVITRGVLRVGAGILYSRTIAFAGYQDPGGTLKIKSNASAILTQGMMGLNLYDVPGGHVYIAAKPGFVFGLWDMRETVVFNEVPEANSDRSVDGKADGVFGELAIGMMQEVWPWLVVATEAGYRFMLTAAELKKGSRKYGLGFSVTGFILSISFGTGI